MQGLKVTIKRLRIFLTALTLTLLAAVDLSAQANQAPLMESIPRLYILEGQELSITVAATDADGDAIVLALLNRPTGAEFTDFGDGTAEFSWLPDFSGPNSSEGSPFTLYFRAGDGVAAVIEAAEIVVINANRCPYIVAPDTVKISAGDTLDLEVTGYDPDYDGLHWALMNQPSGMKIGRGDQTYISWPTVYADSGQHDFSLTLFDDNGAADTAEVVLTVEQTTVYELNIDTVSTYPGELVTVGVNLMNLEPVSAVNLIINYDVSVLTFVAISQEGTRSENWEHFSYNLNDRGIQGDIRLTGIADLDDGVDIGPLTAGDGPLAELSFLVSGNLSYAGQQIPVRFAFRDDLVGDDNTMTDTSGEKITQEQISYESGYVYIQTSTEEGIGDINLNGVAYEIGDVIYLTNFFVDPINNPLSPIQRLNSDVNRDGFGGTIADLVYMINVILTIYNEGGKLTPVDNKVVIEGERTFETFTLYSHSEMELGGLVAVLEAPDYSGDAIRLSESLIEAGLRLRSSVQDDELRILIYSDEARRIPLGRQALIELENYNDLKIKDIQLSTADGQMISAVLKDEADLLPERFELNQNRPNPFNPATEISFDLPRASEVSLAVYNVLGQEIRQLVSGVLPAGNHVVIWDGRDAGGVSASSGIYFYRLEAGQYVNTKKMILLK